MLRYTPTERQGSEVTRAPAAPNGSFARFRSDTASLPHCPSFPRPPSGARRSLSGCFSISCFLNVIRAKARPPLPLHAEVPVKGAMLRNLNQVGKGAGSPTPRKRREASVVPQETDEAREGLTCEQNRPTMWSLQAPGPPAGKLSIRSRARPRLQAPAKVPPNFHPHSQACRNHPGSSSSRSAWTRDDRLRQGGRTGGEAYSQPQNSGPPRFVFHSREGLIYRLVTADTKGRQETGAQWRCRDLAPDGRKVPLSQEEGSSPDDPVIGLAGCVVLVIDPADAALAEWAAALCGLLAG